VIREQLALQVLLGQEVDALYNRLFEEYPQYSDIPSFDQLELEVTPEMEAAAQFLVDLLGDNPSNIHC